MRIILRNIFLEKSCTKCVGKACLRLFSNKLKVSRSLDKQSEIIYFAFIASPIRGLPKYIKTNVCWPLGFSSDKAFLQIRKRSEISLSDSFSAWFLKKNFFSHYILSTAQILLFAIKILNKHSMPFCLISELFIKPLDLASISNKLSTSC